MVEEKCYICNTDIYGYYNGKPICLKHYIEEYWKNERECLESYLDTIVDRLNKYNKLDKDELELLSVLKKEMPEIVKEFPILFNEIDKK